MELCIIETGRSWECENMDNLAPIIDTGTSYLLSNGDVITVWNNKDNDEINLLKIKELPFATNEQRAQFIHEEYGVIFKGDHVVIKRGRKMVGETKEVSGYYRYDVPGTYGKQYTEYLLFTDGTKVNINHCDVVGCVHQEYKDQGEIYYVRRYSEKTPERYLIPVGGRF